MLLTLEKWLGEDVMDKVMRTYFETWKFRHPTTRDFVRVAEDVSGRDLGWFFDQVLASPDKLDYAVIDLQAKEVAPFGGISDEVQGPDAKAALPADGRKTSAAPKTYKSEVVVARLGEWIFPQEVLVTFENENNVREYWDGRDRWKRFVYYKNVKVRSAEVDPGRTMVLDVNYLNNSRVLEPRKPVVAKFAAGLMKWFQGLLSVIAI
jgi:hypothetical protein